MKHFMVYGPNKIYFAVTIVTIDLFPRGDVGIRTTHIAKRITITANLLERIYIYFVFKEILGSKLWASPQNLVSY